MATDEEYKISGIIRKAKADGIRAAARHPAIPMEVERELCVLAAEVEAGTKNV